MTLSRVGNWGGYRVGQIIVANEPFENRVGDCRIDKDVIQLPNGVIIEGVRDTPVACYLAAGTLAVAVEHSGDGFNQYIPVNLTQGEDSGFVMTPFPDLEYGAYTYGLQVGRLETVDMRKIAAGMPIPYPEQIIVPAATVV